MGVVLLVRHGQASFGADDYDVLSETGWEQSRLLGAWLADPAHRKALHEAKSALHALRGRGWTLGGLSSDTALAAYLVRPGQRSFNLDDLSLRYLHRELRTETEAAPQLSLLDAEDAVDAELAQNEMLRARAVADLADAGAVGHVVAFAELDLVLHVAADDAAFEHAHRPERIEAGGLPVAGVGAGADAWVTILGQLEDEIGVPHPVVWFIEPAWMIVETDLDVVFLDHLFDGVDRLYGRGRRRGPRRRR